MMHPTVKFGRFYLLAVNNDKEATSFWPTDKENFREIRSLSSFLKKLSSKYLLAIVNEKAVKCDELSLRRLFKLAETKCAGITYSDFIWKKGNNSIPHPLIDYQPGSIRDDFNFGHFFFFSLSAIHATMRKYGPPPSDTNVALYDLRLKVSIDYPVFHVPESLYIASNKKGDLSEDKDKAAENHFAYAAAKNLTMQKKLEIVATNYLKFAGAYIKPLTKKTIRTNASPKKLPRLMISFPWKQA